MEYRLKDYINSEKFSPSSRPSRREVLGWIKKRVIWGENRNGRWWVDPDRDPADDTQPGAARRDLSNVVPVNDLAAQVLKKHTDKTNDQAQTHQPGAA
ncbi:MAG: hypothetical protein OEZ04_13700 [Nitrospinota bacterium]|nr:hypothetical protein [Nitrospinota bacterium]